MSNLEHQRPQANEADPDIAQTTHELKATYARPAVTPPEANKDKTQRIGHLPLMAGGAAVAIAAVAGGYFATRGGDSDPTSGRPTESVSALPNAPEVNTESKEAVIGQAGSTLENISVKPSQELIDEALQPVTVADFPTVEEAVQQFGRIDNVADLAATIDTDSGTRFPETPASIKLRNKLWENIYSSEGLASLANPDTNIPKIVAMELWYINETGNIPLPKGTVGTWHVEWIPEQVTPIDKNTYEVAFTLQKTTNFHELDEMATNNILNISSTMTHNQRAIISNDGKVWKVDSHTNID